ncbi:MAG: lipid A biosynthesis protein [Nitrospinota bacterium]|nr:MAG: lipid A biosynthesis protein [Nitrospinota bacterium]
MINVWIGLGLLGQLLFFCRFLVQWIVSEKRGESVIPIHFWYLSLAGSFLLLSYAIYRQDPVFILGQSMGAFVYIRNLILIYRKRKRLSSGKGQDFVTQGDPGLPAAGKWPHRSV